MSEWEADIEDWSIVDNEKADFAFKQSEKYLNYTLEVKKALEDKAIRLITTQVTILSVSIAGFVKLVEENPLNLISFLPLLIFIFLYIIAIIFSLQVFRCKDYYIQGNEPQHLWKKELMEQAFKFIQYNECYNYQKKIKTNQKHNNNMSFWFKISLDLSLLAVVFSFLCWLAVIIFNLRY